MKVNVQFAETKNSAVDVHILTDDELDSVTGGRLSDTNFYFSMGVVTFMAGVVGGALGWLWHKLF